MYPTANYYYHKRGKKMIFSLRSNSFLLDNCFFKRATQIWNSINVNTVSLKNSCDTAKNKLKQHFLNIHEKDVINTAYGIVSWRDFRFI